MTASIAARNACSLIVHPPDGGGTPRASCAKVSGSLRHRSTSRCGDSGRTMSHGDGAVHLIGRVPLADAETVFRAVAAALGPHLRRLPDGETGERRRGIYFQRLMLEKHPAMEIDPTVPLFALHPSDGNLLRETPRLRFLAGLDPDGVEFETGYAPAARASHE